MIGTNKLKRLLRAEYPEANVEDTGGNHIRLRFPGGAQVFLPSSPSSQNVLKKVRSQVRRQMSGGARA